MDRFIKIHQKEMVRLTVIKSYKSEKNVTKLILLFVQNKTYNLQKHAFETNGLSRTKE